MKRQENYVQSLQDFVNENKNRRLEKSGKINENFSYTPKDVYYIPWPNISAEQFKRLRYDADDDFGVEIKIVDNPTNCILLKVQIL